MAADRPRSDDGSLDWDSGKGSMEKNMDSREAQKAKLNVKGKAEGGDSKFQPA